MRTRANTDTAKLTRMADKLWQEVICHEGACAVCGKPEVSGHHLIGRAHKGVRWSLMNGLPLCWACHGATHDGGLDLIDWLRITDEDRFWFYHENKSAQPVQVKAHMLVEYIEQLKAVRKSLCNNKRRKEVL